MRLKEEIAALQNRISHAEAECEVWRSSGRQEKYLEAYSSVAAMQLQLERLRQEGLRASGHDGSDADGVAQGLTRFHVEQASDDSRRRLMDRFQISFRGGSFYLAGERFDRLSDAVHHAHQREAE